jgi:hypothetical protein
MYQGIIDHWTATTKAHPRVMLASGTYVAHQDLSATIPFTWTTSDEMACQFMYEAA